MNPEFVADASIALAWAVSSQASPAAARLLDETGAGCFIVPALWPFEVANSLAMLLRRKKVSKDDYLSARLFLDGLRFSIDDQGTRLASTSLADLALEHGLTVYDAAYLELAIRKQLPLASRDGNLNKAARRCGVQVLV